MPSQARYISHNGVEREILCPSHGAKAKGAAVPTGKTGARHNDFAKFATWCAGVEKIAASEVTAWCCRACGDTKIMRGSTAKRLLEQRAATLRPGRPSIGRPSTRRPSPIGARTAALG